LAAIGPIHALTVIAVLGIAGKGIRHGYITSGAVKDRAVPNFPGSSDGV
jgi:hypothetical protein